MDTMFKLHDDLLPEKWFLQKKSLFAKLHYKRIGGYIGI